MSNPQRELLFARSAGICQCIGACALHAGRCRTGITLETFHRSHLRSRAHGGIDDNTNLEAWCSRCNLTLQSRDASDPRLPPREWQLRELDRIVGAITRTGAATLSAAPGAGKTIFTGLVFEALRDAGIAARLMVVVPRRGLADQWAKALAVSRHIQLKTHSAFERPGQHGVVVTYQSLPNRDQLEAHRLKSQQVPTLLALDEVHHLARDADGSHRSWADAINEFAGDVESHNIHVAGILNLSGTLWRSDKTERISTVRYTPPDQEGKIVSLVDGSVTVEELIREGLLRSIDLYRLGARVSLADYQQLQIVEGNLADVDDKAARAAVQHLATITSWRAAFVASVLDKLEQAHRATSHHVKALIVASRQDHAEAFKHEVDRQMRARGLQPLAQLAISRDEDEAQQALDNFREQRRVGVLCTVDMAGEGYDCPDIVVLGYASNKLTPLYVRQVTARAMRVTDRERELGATLPAIVVLPDSPALVEQFLAYMAPALHEIRVSDEHLVRQPVNGDVADAEIAGPRLQRFMLTDARAEAETVSVSFLDGSYENIDTSELAAAARSLELVNMPEVYRPRALAFHRRTIAELLQRRPFDAMYRPGSPSSAEPTVTQPSVEQRCEMLQNQIRQLEKWWAVHGNKAVPINHFAYLVNQAGGISSRQRGSASPAQLERSLQFAQQYVDAFRNKS
jgi:superfamily II DNA or RNA helicase